MTEKTYTALVVKEPDTSYWVHFPDFRYCFTCGDTLENAESAARDALDTHIGGMAADGYAIPEPTPLRDILAQNKMNIVAALDIPVEVPDTAAKNKIIPLSSHRRNGGPKLS
jgi:predicted RNase H-like HicB family nuclease